MIRKIKISLYVNSEKIQKSVALLLRLIRAVALGVHRTLLLARHVGEGSVAFKK